MNTSALAPEDSMESHIGNPNAPDPADMITWVWFRTPGNYGHKADVIGMRIADSLATVSISTPATQAAQIVPFGKAWARCLAFLAANPNIRTDS